MNSYLEHHGVKGQRWGVRRYRKRDGTLTKLGRQRYRELASDYMQRNPEQYRHKRDRVHDNLSKAGVVKRDSDSDIIKKGSELQRVANDTEILDDKSRYMTITKNDNDNYASHWEHFVDMGRWDGDAVINKYRATRDLKVATGEKVVND